MRLISLNFEYLKWDCRGSSKKISSKVENKICTGKKTVKNKYKEQIWVKRGRKNKDEHLR